MGPDSVHAVVATLTPTVKLELHVMSMVPTAIRNAPFQTMRELGHALNVVAALGAMIQSSREDARPAREDIGDDIYEGSEETDFVEPSPGMNFAPSRWDSR